jgi:cyclopropane-fatty-acyl-phospholipid synthase
MQAAARHHTTDPAPTLSGLPVAERAPWACRWALAKLKQLPVGRLVLGLPDGGTLVCGVQASPEVHMSLHHWRALTACIQRGDIGLAEGHIAGDWSTPDLPGLLGLLAANRQGLEQLVYGRWWGTLFQRLQHALNRNSRAGSRRNIHAHYDLGNDFYRLWLDDSMSYSAACFEGQPTRSLYEAQTAKVRRALSALALRPGQRLLEVGCGWGHLAMTAAQEQGVQVLGLTLSKEQLAHARDHVQAAGLQAQVELRLQDYRDIADEAFDGIVSIEMFEAVGRAYWGTYFNTLARLLSKGGRACVQSIVIRNDLFDRYAKGTDFIQQYIFPGGMLPSAEQFCAHARAAGLEVVEQHAFGLDYAHTLSQWRTRYLAQLDAVRALGHDEAFIRTWEFYLAYCEAAFRSGNTDVVQFTLRHIPTPLGHS